MRYVCVMDIWLFTSLSTSGALFIALIWHIQINATWSLSYSMVVFFSLSQTMNPLTLFRCQNVNFQYFHFDHTYIERGTFLYRLNDWMREKDGGEKKKSKNKTTFLVSMRIVFILRLLRIFFFSSYLELNGKSSEKNTHTRIQTSNKV